MTQSGGQSAGIQLQVGLDLAYFRQQLTTLGTAAAGYKLPINIKFDRLAIQSELNTLAANIKRRKYFLEVKTNLGAEIDNAKKLADALVRLQQVAQGAKGALPVGTKALGVKKGPGQPGANEIKSLYEALAMAGVEGFEQGSKKNRAQMVTQIGAVAKDTVAGLLNGLKSQDARVQAAAKSLGASLIASMKAVLGIASPSKEFEKIGKNVGEGFENGALSSMDNAFDALENKVRQRGKILDTIARGIFRMLGMDPAAMLEKARQERLPASINWLATAPPRRAFMGPSSSGRTLPPGPSQEMLPGSSFATQKLLSGDLLTPSMKAAIRDVANDLIDGIRERINAAIREVRVEDLGKVAQKMLTGSPVAGYLPPVARFGEGRTPSPYSTGRLGRDGETRAELFARREREARMRSALREMDAMGGGTGRTPSPYRSVNRAARPTGAMIPYAAGGALVPVGGGRGGVVPPRPPSSRAGSGGLGGFGRALSNVNLPGAGVVREIGDEFAMATKQVLLFGTAYKALAFATSFPAQVGQAVGALQSFNNTLKAISPTADEARASNQFILDIVDRYNVPLQSARDGFTKLYASMAPAGFKGDEIRALFTGVSQAAATFGMSADKVDRVNYAFAQMASKGQVMSEELKGQLGDVLPGAMGIFAEAAGFEGSAAIEKFSKALEDGAYKGDAMRQLLKNVTVVLTKEFGPGAEGAARTFQGVINRMQNSTKLLYEAFEPVAVGFLNSVVVPLTSGIRTIADGFSAFFKGVRAQTSGGFTIAQELEKLRPAFDGIRANVATLVPMLQTLGGVLLEVSKIFLQIASNPFVGYLARIYLSALPVVVIIKALSVQALIPLIGNLLRAIPAFITFNSLMLQGNKAGLALKTTTMLLGSTTAATASQIRVMSTALKAAFASTAVLAVVAGIGMIIEKMMSLSARLEEVRRKAMGTAESIRAMSRTEARQAANQAASDVKLIQGVSQRQQVAGYPGRIAVTPQEQAALERANVVTQTTATREGRMRGFKQTVGITQLRGAIEKRQGDMREAEYRQRVEKFNSQQQALPTVLPAITSPGEKDQKEDDRRIRDASRLNQLIQQQLEAQNRLGLIGKDELSQIEAKTQLAEEILALTLKDIRLTETGAIQAQSITNATLAYQVTVAELKKEWDDVIKKIADAEKEGRGLYESILQQRNVEQSPLQKALTDIQDQAQNSIEKIDELLNSLAGQAGTRPEGLRARGALGNLRTSLQERTPEQERLLASQKVTKTVKDDLEEQLRGLLDEGKTLTTLDEIIIKIGDDWGALSPQVQGDLAQLAGRIDAAKPFAEIASAIRESREELARMTSASTLIVSSANSISDAFGTAFKGVITGSMTAREALAGFFQSLADSFADMVSKMIAEYLKMALIKGITSLIPGLGSIGDGLGSSASNLDKYAPLLPMANGGIAPGGFQAFANGGIVTGPTLGLVGEGRYNEAVIPLPDGKSVPVDLGGAMGGNITSNIVVNVSSDGKVSSSGGGADAAGFGRKLEGAVRQVITGELRPGGLLAKRN